jgi:membrane protease YdiL (CAAX protease family)
MNKLVKIGIYIIVGLAGFLLCSILSSIILLINHSIIFYIIQMILSIVFSLLLIFILCKYFHKIKLYDLGICNLSKIFKWAIIAVLLPTLVITFFIVFIPGQMKFTEINGVQLLNKIGLGVLLIGISTGLTEELWFRGYIMKLIEKNNGKKMAIILSAVVFSLLHMLNIKPEYNAFDIILKIFNGILVGIMFALIMYKSNSIWSAVIVHIFWNALTTGIIHVGIIESEIALFNYIPEKDLNIITGGNIGLEVSLPATIGYIIVIILCIIKKKNNDVRPYCT